MLLQEIVPGSNTVGSTKEHANITKKTNAPKNCCDMSPCVWPSLCGIADPTRMGAHRTQSLSFFNRFSSHSKLRPYIPKQASLFRSRTESYV